MFLPRATELDLIHVWSESYDEVVAMAAVRRLQAVKDAIVALDPESNPERWELFPADYGSCRHCPWLKPGSRQLAAGCPGRLDDGAPAASVTKLIAQAESEVSECQHSTKSTT